MYKLCFAFALVAFFSCGRATDQPTATPLQSKTERFKEDVALYDIRVRAVDPESFVKELVFADFSDDKILGNAVIFQEVAYSDDGKQFDSKAGDGIFTGVEKSAYNASVKTGSLTGSQPKSLLDAPIVNPEFKRFADLATYELNAARYVTTASNARAARPRVYVCTVTYGGDHCLAHYYDWCNNCCVSVSCGYQSINALNELIL